MTTHRASHQSITLGSNHFQIQISYRVYLELPVCLGRVICQSNPIHLREKESRLRTFLNVSSLKSMILKQILLSNKKHEVKQTSLKNLPLQANPSSRTKGGEPKLSVTEDVQTSKSSLKEKGLMLTFPVNGKRLWSI